MSYEKEFIDRWVPKNSVRGKAICWKDLREELEKRFNIIRPENIVKNYWYSKMRKENKERKQGKRQKFLTISSPCHFMGYPFQSPFDNLKPDPSLSYDFKLYTMEPCVNNNIVSHNCF